MRLRVTEIRIERARLALRLAALPGVRRVYPSQGNFLLVRFADADMAYARLLAAGVVVRDMRQLPQLDDALRITIVTPVQNDVVVSTLQAEEATTCRRSSSPSPTAPCSRKTGIASSTERVGQSMSI